MKKYIWVILLAVVTITVMILSLMEAIDKSLGMCIALGLIIVFNIIMLIISLKNDVKIISIIMGIFAFLSIVLLIMNIIAYTKTNTKNEFKFQVMATPNISEKNLIFEHEGKSYYTYNLNNVNVKMYEDDQTYNLKEAITQKIVTLDEILSLAIPNDNTYGYKIYYDGGTGKMSNDKYSIVVCENGKNIIFSTYDYEYEEAICK